MSKLIWTCKQAIPLTYRSHYSDSNGDKHFCVWQMWMGKVFNVDDVIVC